MLRFFLRWVLFVSLAACDDDPPPCGELQHRALPEPEPGSDRDEVAAWNEEYLCDIDANAIDAWIRPSFRFDEYASRSGCGYETHFEGGLHVQSARVFDSTTHGLLGTYSYFYDDAGYVYARCSSIAIASGLYPAPTCPEERRSICRPRNAPCSLISPAASFDGLGSDLAAIAFRMNVSTLLSEHDAGLDCTIDPATAPTTGTGWPVDYHAIRTEGCGLVTFDSPILTWERESVYDIATGQLVGVRSSESSSTPNASNCSSVDESAGGVPAPPCASDVVRWCRVVD